MKHVANDQQPQKQLMLSRFPNTSRCDEHCYAAPVNDFRDELDLSFAAPLFFGPEYSSECQVIAQVAPFYNLIQISSQPSAPALSDRTKYPNMFRTLMSSNAFVNIPRALMTYFNYTRAALISFDDSYAIEPMQKIDYDLHSHDIDVLFNLRYRPSLNDTVDHVLQSIMLFDARIIIIWSNNLEDYRLYCRAMDNKNDPIKIGKQLIISVGLTDAVAIAEPTQIVDRPDCTREKLAQMTNGSFLIWVSLKLNSR